MARVLASCLDWRSRAIDLSSSNNGTAKTEIPSHSAALQKIANLEIADRHSTKLLQNVPTGNNLPQLLVPPLAEIHHQREESSVNDEMFLPLPHLSFEATSSPLRSKVLLVEDNAINMKVGLQILLCPGTNTDIIIIRFSSTTCGKRNRNL